MSKQPPPAPTASAVGPCPTKIKICRTPRHWKFTQHHRTTRPPLIAYSSMQTVRDKLGWGRGGKHVLLDSNPRPFLLQWFETFCSHEAFLTHQSINTGNKQIADNTFESEMKTRQKQRILTPGGPFLSCGSKHLVRVKLS